MFWNGSVVAWKVMIYLVMFGLTVAAIVSALRERKRKNQEREQRLGAAFNKARVRNRAWTP